MSLPPSSIPLPGLQWIPGVNAVEIQQSSGLTIDAKTLNYSTFTEIDISQTDLWRAINGLLGLTSDPAKNRYYLGAPHPIFTEIIETSESASGEGTETTTERIPMLWADTIHLTPLDDHYKGVDGEYFPGDGGNPQTLHFRNCRIRVTYSNDSIHYSRIKCSWTPKLEQEYTLNGTKLVFCQLG